MELELEKYKQLNENTVCSGARYIYTEEYDEEHNVYKIQVNMYIDMKTKTASNKLKSAWEKDKSLLLIEMQNSYRQHEKMKKEGKASRWYDMEKLAEITTKKD